MDDPHEIAETIIPMIIIPMIIIPMIIIPMIMISAGDVEFPEGKIQFLFFLWLLALH